MVSKMQGFSIPSFASLPNSSLHVLFVWAPIFFLIMMLCEEASMGAKNCVISSLSRWLY